MDNQSEKEGDDLTYMSLGVDRIKLKEQRILRNKQKRAAKKLQNQIEREHKELLLKMQPRGSNVTLVTRDFADIIANNASSDFNNLNISVNKNDFPVLGERCRISKSNSFCTKGNIPEEPDVLYSNKKCSSKIELADFITSPTCSSAQPKKAPVPTTQWYNGNPLDSDLPVRRKGKFREVPRTKKLTKLKCSILMDKSELEKSEQCTTNIDTQFENLNVSTPASSFYNDVRHFVDETEESTALIKSFVSALVTLQEKLYKRDPIKGTSKRRYVIGLHEARKQLKLNKVKILIIASDIQITNCEDTLSTVLNYIVDLAKANDIPYLFVLKRRLLGTLTMKHIPVSCIAVLNHEGLQEQYNIIKEMFVKWKSQYEEIEKATKGGDKTTELVNNLIDALK